MYLESKSFPSDPSQAKRLLNQPRKGYHAMDSILYSEDQIYQTKGNLSSYLRERLINDQDTMLQERQCERSIGTITGVE